MHCARFPTASTSAATASGEAGGVAQAAEEVRGNVDTLSAGTEQMTASIHQIADNAREASRVAEPAVAITDATSESVTRLGTSSTESANSRGHQLHRGRDQPAGAQPHH